MDIKHDCWTDFNWKKCLGHSKNWPQANEKHYLCIYVEVLPFVLNTAFKIPNKLIWISIIGVL